MKLSRPVVSSILLGIGLSALGVRSWIRRAHAPTAGSNVAASPPREPPEPWCQIIASHCGPRPAASAATIAAGHLDEIDASAADAFSTGTTWKRAVIGRYELTCSIDTYKGQAQGSEDCTLTDPACAGRVTYTSHELATSIELVRSPASDTVEIVDPGAVTPVVGCFTRIDLKAGEIRDR